MIDSLVPLVVPCRRGQGLPVRLRQAVHRTAGGMRPHCCHEAGVLHVLCVLRVLLLALVLRLQQVVHRNAGGIGSATHFDAGGRGVAAGETSGSTEPTTAIILRDYLIAVGRKTKRAAQPKR